MQVNCFSARNIIIFILFIMGSIGSPNILADEKTTNSNNGILHILPEGCVFSGQFEQLRQLNTIPTPLKSSGKLFFSCNQGLIWENRLPFPESLIYTKQGLHFRLLKQNQITPLEGLQHYYLAKFLLSLLSADTKAIEEDFTIKKVDDNSANHFTLLPKSEITQKGLESISIQKKTDASTHKKEQLIITIRDGKQQNTQLIMDNLLIHNNENTYCNDVQESVSPCNILKNPAAYQPVESNN